MRVRFFIFKGECLPEEIDDFIDEWHDGDFEEELHEFLGMSWKEYSLWVSNPDVLPYIIKARMENSNVEDILREEVSKNRLPARID